MTAPLHEMARIAAAREDRSLGYALAQLGHTEAALLAALGCTPDQLTMLRLCRRPDASAYLADLTRVCDHTGVDLGRLRAVIAGTE